LEQPELQLDHAAQLVRRRVELRELLLQIREELLDAVFEERHEELVLRAEVEVNRPVGDAGRLRGLAHARGIEAAPGEDLHRRAQDALALVAPTACAPFARLLGTALRTE